MVDRNPGLGRRASSEGTGSGASHSNRPAGEYAVDLHWSFAFSYLGRRSLFLLRGRRLAKPADAGLLLQILSARGRLNGSCFLPPPASIGGEEPDKLERIQAYCSSSCDYRLEGCCWSEELVSTVPRPRSPHTAPSRHGSASCKALVALRGGAYLAQGGLAALV